MDSEATACPSPQSTAVSIPAHRAVTTAPTIEQLASDQEKLQGTHTTLETSNRIKKGKGKKEMMPAESPLLSPGVRDGTTGVGDERAWDA